MAQQTSLAEEAERIKKFLEDDEARAQASRDQVEASRRGRVLEPTPSKEADDNKGK